MIVFLIVLALFIVLVNIADRYVQKLIYPQKYSEYVERYSNEYGVSEYIVYSVIMVESGFDKDAVSEAGACGLMQLMPQTYEWLCEMLDIDLKTSSVFDEETNIMCGTYYLSLLYDRYGDWTLAFCAYNAGMGNVDKWLEKEHFSIEFPETQYYVKKLEVVREKYFDLYYR
ncbi:MAG: lytic transglycosylase domain-containing protein [Clostridia bacterium]|nr:lytic transglycosylase domain-containing protein [Clostridia bacterium]